MIYTNNIERICKYVPTAKNMYILVYEQAVCGRDKKWKKALLMMLNSKMVLAMLGLLYNGEAGDNISIIQRSEAKESRNGFLEHSYYCSQTT